MYSDTNKQNNDSILGNSSYYPKKNKKNVSVITGKIQLSHKGNMSCVSWEI